MRLKHGGPGRTRTKRRRRALYFLKVYELSRGPLDVSSIATAPYLGPRPGVIGTRMDCQMPSKLITAATAVAASAVSKAIGGSRSAG